MARPSAAAAAAALLLLLLSLLAVANCRPHEARPAIATDAEPSSAAVAAAGDVDDDVNSPANITLPAEAEQQQRGFLRLPSHLQRRHHPCRHGPFHRHLWWAPRHDHGAFGDDAPRRFHHHRHHVEALRCLPADETREAGEVKAVAEPDTDRSMIAESDGELERAVAASMEPSFGDAAYGGAGEQAAHEAGDGAAAVRAWKREMLRRWVQFHHHRHHGMRLHRHHGDEQEEEEAGAEGMKLFHHHHHRHGEDDDEEKDMMTRKKFRHGDDHDDDSDGDSDDDEVEEMVRRFRKAIMRRRFGGHGRRRRRFHHHHHHYGHRHGEEAEEGGVVSWIKGLANWF